MRQQSGLARLAAGQPMALALAFLFIGPRHEPPAGGAAFTTESPSCFQKGLAFSVNQAR